MTVLDRNGDNRALLSALAFALVDRPRASLLDLARAVGVGKTTLHRFCRTREELIDRLMEHTAQVLGEMASSAQLGSLPPFEALKWLNVYSLEHKELNAFLLFYWRESEASSAIDSCYVAAIDSFFLRGQREGVFRIDVSASALTEIWFSSLTGLIYAERRGRIARGGLPALLQTVLVEGICSSN
ncbi:TetR/AcrR family transcriptional regulator [Pseudomonas sp. Z1-14]